MSQIVIISAFNKYELDQILKNQKKAVKDKKRDIHLENLDNLLSRISSLSQYQSMKIKNRALISHLSENIFLTLYSIFNLI